MKKERILKLLKEGIINELNPKTYIKAGEKLRKMGHTSRGNNLINYGKDNNAFYVQIKPSHPGNDRLTKIYKITVNGGLVGDYLPDSEIANIKFNNRRDAVKFKKAIQTNNFDMESDNPEDIEKLKKLIQNKSINELYSD